MKIKNIKYVRNNYVSNTDKVKVQMGQFVIEIDYITR